MMPTISTNNSKSVIINPKPISISPSSILEYTFLKSKKTYSHMTQNESQTDLTANTKITNQSFNKDHSRDKSAPSYRSSSFRTKKLDSYYNKSKEQQRLRKRKIDYHRNLKHQKELQEHQPFVPLGDVSRELYKNQLIRSKSVGIPVYKRQKEKINVNNIRNLKQLIINEGNTSSISKNSKCFKKKIFDNWLQKNELWKKNSMTKTINKVKTRMIEINEQEEQFHFKPQLNNTNNNTLHYIKSRNKSSNNLSTTVKSLKTNHSVSSLKKEYDKMKIIPSFKPVINGSHNCIRKKRSPISIKSNYKKSNKGIILKLQPTQTTNKTHEYWFSSFQNENIVNQQQITYSKNNNIFNTNGSNGKEKKISDELYKLNVRDKLPNQIPLNVILSKKKKCL